MMPPFRPLTHFDLYLRRRRVSLRVFEPASMLEMELILMDLELAQGFITQQEYSTRIAQIHGETWDRSFESRARRVERAVLPRSSPAVRALQMLELARESHAAGKTHEAEVCLVEAELFGGLHTKGTHERANAEVRATALGTDSEAVWMWLDARAVVLNVHPALGNRTREVAAANGFVLEYAASLDDGWMKYDLVLKEALGGLGRHRHADEFRALFRLRAALLERAPSAAVVIERAEAMGWDDVTSISHTSVIPGETPARMKDSTTTWASLEGRSTKGTAPEGQTADMLF